MITSKVHLVVNCCLQTLRIPVRAELMLFVVPQISRILPAGRFARQGSELAAAVSAVGAAMLKIATCWQAYATVSI